MNDTQLENREQIADDRGGPAYLQQRAQEQRSEYILVESNEQDQKWRPNKQRKKCTGKRAAEGRGQSAEPFQLLPPPVLPPV
jgi:hypothetical protein